MRREFSAKIKLAAFQRANGVCEMCGAQLKPGRIEYDHRVPCALGGEATLKNCECICRECHSEKTHGQDRPAIYKAQRLEKKDAGIRKRSRWPAGKDAPFKQKIGGGIVPRT